MGWTNSVPIFHDDVTFILQLKIPDTTIPYIDNVLVCSPATQYPLPDGSPETHLDNPRIHRFIWEHFQSLNHVVQHMKYSSGTFSGHKIAAQENLKAALLASPALHLIDYSSKAPVILAVDTSHITVSFHLCQCDPNNSKICYYARFNSITLNDHEARFSQPKLELYGLFRALRSLKLYLISIYNLIIEVDTHNIKGMLANSDLKPSTNINHWILSILTFHFTLVHVPGTLHTPDGLLCCPPQPGNIAEPSDDFDD
ncbi:hypothetical protein EW146_g8481 [Bondarzewia mesenterica]|uniref:Reverse transcriptase RNase H-like domain-containing protein n=1 Tax=Bondarzewia mesenterica TaxID=1095465 RepID=A0A4S4LEL9_9AGAM|nr:hypothetical protein EW146_g8481 [Bondarzewia mesenterica]